MDRPLRVLHVMAGFYPALRYGGPIESVFRLCQALPAEGVHVDVVTTNADGGSDLDVPLGRPVFQGGVPVRYFQWRPRTNFAFSRELFQHMIRVRRDYDLWHVTGVFDFPSMAGALVPRMSKVPYVLSPRGSLRPWARGQGSRMKAPFWALVGGQNARGAAALHATSDDESAELRALLPDGHVFTIPNGIELAETAFVPRAARRVVFVGRLHPVKGFDVLIPALSLLAKAMPDVETVVAGPDDHGEWARIEERLSRAHPRPNVRHIGALGGADRDRLMAGATLLVLPSHSENFGQVVLEAMGQGTPVVVSRNCPWKSVEDEGAGLWVPNEPGPMAAALGSILRDAALATSMGQAGRRLAARFTWPAVAARMAAEYRKAVDRARTAV